MSQRWALVKTPNSDDYVKVGSLSFDGGSLIVFDDPDRRIVKRAYGPGGWLTFEWKEPENASEVQT